MDDDGDFEDPRRLRRHQHDLQSELDGTSRNLENIRRKTDQQLRNQARRPVVDGSLPPPNARAEQLMSAGPHDRQFGRRDADRDRQHGRDREPPPGVFDRARQQLDRGAGGPSRENRDRARGIGAWEHDRRERKRGRDERDYDDRRDSNGDGDRRGDRSTAPAWMSKRDGDRATSTSAAPAENDKVEAADKADRPDAENDTIDASPGDGGGAGRAPDARAPDTELEAGEADGSVAASAAPVVIRRGSGSGEAAGSSSSSAAAPPEPAASSRPTPQPADPALQQRNKRLFGALFSGTLNKAKARLESDTEKSLAQKRKEQLADASRKEAELLHQKDEERKRKMEEQRKAREAIFERQREEKEAELEKRDELLAERAKVDVAAIVATALRHGAALDAASQAFLRTTTEPVLFWKPVRNNIVTSDLMRDNYRVVRQESGERKTRLAQLKLDSIREADAFVGSARARRAARQAEFESRRHAARDRGNNSRGGDRRNDGDSKYSGRAADTQRTDDDGDGGRRRRDDDGDGSSRRGENDDHDGGDDAGRRTRARTGSNADGAGADGGDAAAGSRSRAQSADGGTGTGGHGDNQINRDDGAGAGGAQDDADASAPAADEPVMTSSAIYSNDGGETLLDYES